MSSTRGNVYFYLLLAISGLLSFLFFSNLFQFKDRLNDLIYPKPASQASDLTYSMYVDAPEKFLGPDVRLADSQVAFDHSDPTKLRAYISSGVLNPPDLAKYKVAPTFLLTGSDEMHLQEFGQTVLNFTGPITKPANDDYFDGCGDWIKAVYPSTVDPNKMIGWYHAELCKQDPLDTGVDVRWPHWKTIGYTERSKSSELFTKPGYEGAGIDGNATINHAGNMVIRPDQRLTDKNLVGWYNSAGDMNVIPYPANQAVPDYYFMYFRESYDSDDLTKFINDPTKFDAKNHPLIGPNNAVHLARAAANTDGKPGSWFKYYQGAFTEPGLGGKSNLLTVDDGTAFGRLAWAALYNQTLNSYLGLGVFKKNLVDPSNPTLGSQSDYQIATSPDGITNWKAGDSPIFFLDRSSNTVGQLYSPVPAGHPWYFQLAGPGGDPVKADKNFYLYFSFNPPEPPNKSFGQDNNIYKLRRQIILKQDTDLGVANNINKIKFNSYQTADGKDSWDTTGITVYAPDVFNKTYQLKTDLGYLLTTAANSDSKLLYSCVKTDSHFKPLNHLVTDNKADCPGTYGLAADVGKWVYFERIGYTLPPLTPTSKVLFRCYNATTDTYFVSLDDGCNNKGTKDKTLGNTLIPNALPGDVNGDNHVTSADYTRVVSDFLQTGLYLIADLNRDGVVDLKDYNLVVSHLGL